MRSCFLGAVLSYFHVKFPLLSISFSSHLCRQHGGACRFASFSGAARMVPETLKRAAHTTPWQRGAARQFCLRDSQKARAEVEGGCRQFTVVTVVLQ